MARCKCRICGAQLNTSTAYKLAGSNGKNAYYCSLEEYQTEENRKYKAQADKDKAYRLVCEILGENDVINSALWKEWAEWGKVATDEKIAMYLAENKDYLVRVMSNINGTSYGRIRYLSAIIKNNITDFKEQEVEEPKIVQIDMTMYNTTPLVPKQRRRSLASLEDEI